MTRLKTISLGLATLWPPVHIAAFIPACLAYIIIPTFPDEVIWGLLGSNVLTVVLCIALMPIYLNHVTRNPTLDKRSRSTWGLLIIIAAPFIMPYYFFRYVVREEDGMAR